MLNITYILISCTIDINFYCDNPSNPFSCAFTHVQLCKEKFLILPLDFERQIFQDCTLATSTHVYMSVPIIN